MPTISIYFQGGLVWESGRFLSNVYNSMGVASPKIREALTFVQRFTQKSYNFQGASLRIREAWLLCLALPEYQAMPKPCINDNTPFCLWRSTKAVKGENHHKAISWVCNSHFQGWNSSNNLAMLPFMIKQSAGTCKLLTFTDTNNTSYPALYLWK